MGMSGENIYSDAESGELYDDTQSVEPQGEPTNTEQEPIVPEATETVQDSPETELGMFDIPTEFKDATEALTWYATQFEQVKQTYGSINPQEVQQRIFEEQSQAVSQEIEGFKIMYEALKTNPEEFVMQYLPEVLAKHGIEPVLTPDAMADKIENRMEQEFGSDYKMKYNANDLIDPRSLSNQILHRQQQLYNDYTTMNQANQQRLGEWNQNLAQGRSNLAPNQEYTREQVIEHAQQFYPEFEAKGFSTEDFNQFVTEAADYKITLDDVHKALYFDGYMQVAYERGLEEGKSGIYNKITKEGNGERVLPDSVSRLINQRSQPAPSDNQFPFFGMEQNIIPNY